MKITFEKHEVEYILELLKKHICDCYLEKEWNNACTASTIKYFEKEKEISPDQADTATFIWSMTSEIIHEGVNKTLPTQYTNRALVYGLCDAILWFKSKMIEHGCK